MKSPIWAFVIMASPLSIWVWVVFAAVAYADPTCSYWMEDIAPQGVAAFNPNSSYVVFRNVMDHGAKGDGVTDDTAAINSAISSGGRFGPASNQQSTTTPAVVYFPAGNYLISAPIIDYYYTQIIGNPNCLPTITAANNFTQPAYSQGAKYNFMIDGNYLSGFSPDTVLFYRQIRNFILDMTQLNSQSTVQAAISWSTAQATSLQNILFKMHQDANTNQTGLLMGDGSGGFLNDLVFVGGKNGMNVGNQQFTMRNLSFSNAQTAIQHHFSWGWTYQGIEINNCTIGLDMSNAAVSGVTFIDSSISDTAVGFKTAKFPVSNSSSASLILENVALQSVPIAVQNAPNKVALAGTTSTKPSKLITAWAQGHRYTASTGGPKTVQGTITANPRPASLLNGTSFYTQSKPQYEALTLASFSSVRDQGAVGDGITDDTAAVQNAINSATTAGQVLFFDAGTYKVTSTILVPPGARMVGESYSVIMSSGAFFNKLNAPKPVVQVGNAGGQAGTVQWSDMIVATQGQQQGAILIEWNLISPTTAPSGMWDVHARIGGFTGSKLQLANCPKTPGTTITQSNYKKSCVSGYITMYITAPAKGLYMENVWLWTADHDLDSTVTGNGGMNTQITIYNARGLLCESTKGVIWMWGVALEHHTLYQYQFVNTQNIFMSQLQSETPYYQPNPPATIPFAPVAALNDPVFNTTPLKVNGTSYPNADAWGLRTIDSQNLLIYGAGHYSFFQNNSNSCAGTTTCQSRIISIESTTTAVSPIYLYDVHTVGTYVQISLLNGKKRDDLALYTDNIAGFPDEIAIYKPV